MASLTVPSLDDVMVEPTQDSKMGFNIITFDALRSVYSGLRYHWSPKALVFLTFKAKYLGIISLIVCDIYTDLKA